MTKYGAIRTTVDGIIFASNAEAKRYNELKILQRIGEITNLKTHPKFLITMKGEKICHVILDFSYLQGTKWVYEDVKGMDNAVSRLKRRLLEVQHGIKVTLITKKMQKLSV